MDHSKLKKRSASSGDKGPSSGGKTPLPSPVEGAMEAFPLESLPPVMNDYVQATAEALNCDPSMVALPLLAVMGGCIGATRRILLKKGWSEQPCIWAVVMADSGSAKSPALDSASGFLKRRQTAEFKRHERELAEWERTILDLKAKAKGKDESPPEEPPKPKLIQVFTKDATLEKLGEMLRDNPRGIVSIQDELIGFFGALNQYRGGKGGDREAFLSMYSGEALKIDRISRGTLLVPAPFVAIVGCSTPDSLRAVLSKDGNSENGLAARFLICNPPLRMRKWTDATIPEEVAERLGDRISELLDLCLQHDEFGNMHPAFLPLESDAKEVWKEWVNRHAAEQMAHKGAVAAAFSKLQGTCARIALVLQLADRPEAASVSGFWMEAACKIAQWAKSEQIRFWLGSGEAAKYSEQVRLAEWVRGQGGEVRVRDLLRVYRPRPSDMESARGLLAELVKQGLGKFHTVPTTGRPAEAFRLYEAGDTRQENPEEDELPSPDEEESDSPF
jgi:hypothetical protein